MNQPFGLGILDLIALSLILLFAAVLGLRILQALGFAARGRAAGITLGAGIGLALISHTFYGLGLAGMYNGWATAGILAATYLLSRRRILPFLAELTDFPSEALTVKDKWLSPIRSLRPGKHYPEILLVSLLLIFVLIALVRALSPEVGADALIYHLAIPLSFLRTGKIAVDQEWTTTGYPLMTEMLFGIGLSLHRPILAKLFHFAFGVLAALAVYAVTKEAMASDTHEPGQKRRAGLWAAAIFFMTPVFGFQLGTANVELAQAFYALLLAFCLIKHARQPMQIRWLFLGGLMAGLTVAAKYNGLFFILGGGLSVFIGTARSTAKHRLLTALRQSSLFLIVAIISFGPWWIKNLILLDNPVYPFMVQAFGGAPDLVAMVTSWRSEVLIDRFGLGHSLTDLLLLPWRLTFDPESFGGYAIGLVYLLCAPLLIYHYKSIRQAATPLMLSGVAFGFFALTSHQARFLTPILALYCPAVGIALTSTDSSKLRQALKIIVVGLCVFNLPWLNHLVSSQDKPGPGLALDLVRQNARPASFVKRTWTDVAEIYGYIEDQTSPDSVIFDFKSPLRALTSRTVRHLIDSPSAFRLFRNWSAGEDLAALDKMKRMKVNYVSGDAYLESTLFDAPFWNRLSAPVFKSGDRVIRRFYLAEKIPTYRMIMDQAALQSMVAKTEAGSLSLDWPEDQAMPDGCCLLILYDPGDPGGRPALLKLMADDELIGQRQVPHLGKYRLEGELPAKPQTDRPLKLTITARSASPNERLVVEILELQTIRDYYP